MMTNPVLRAAFLGMTPYLEAVKLQERLRQEVREHGQDALLLLEHPHVFTLGRNARRDDVRATTEWLRHFGVAVYECDRGGQVTYHGPGQLVGYPIVNLSPDRRDLRRYVRDLQTALVRTLEGLGVRARGGEEASAIGVWVDESDAAAGPTRAAKIASIGVHVQRWVTTHGFALNVATDLELFSGIVACGLSEVRMTSVEAITGARAAPMATIAQACARQLAAVLDRDLRWLAPEALLAGTETPQSLPGADNLAHGAGGL